MHYLKTPVAPPGDREPNYIVVSVTEANGDSVHNLANFEDEAFVSAQTGGDVVISEVIPPAPAGIPGWRPWPPPTV